MTLNPILYAEDEEDDVFFFQRAVEDAAILNPLAVVSDGKKALDYFSGTGSKAREHPLPCLVILDLKLPIKSGFEVLAWIRAQPAFCTLPVIILTSSSQDMDVHRAYSQGANGFLVKPGTPSELLIMAKAIKDYWLTQNRATVERLPTEPSQAMAYY